MRRLLSVFLGSFLFVLPFTSLAATLTVPAVINTSALRGEETVFTVKPSASETTINVCYLYVEGTNRGTMTYNSDTLEYSRSFTFTSTGEFEVYARCNDASNKGYNGVLKNVTVSEPPDLVYPTVGTLTLTTGMVDAFSKFSVEVSDNVGVTSCNVVQDGVVENAMNIAFGKATIDYKFYRPGEHTFAVRCSDAAGNTTTGAPTVISVRLAKTDLVSGDLFKLSCPASATLDVNHPCKAVYYYGSDGKRHAFPNEQTYWTWYGAFGNIVLVTPELMQNIPLGRNVTYKPGARLVKFTTSNRVYAVSKGGVLHAIANEAIAISIFGADWAKMVDDINDVFYGNYVIGDEIDSSRGWDQKKTLSSTKVINDSLTP